MSQLSTTTALIFIFTPLVLTIALLCAVICARWLRTSRNGIAADVPSLLLAAAVRRLPPERSEWGEAMMAELVALRGTAFRWRFALGCAQVAIFPPATTEWSRYLRDTFKRLGPVCGLLSVLLPPLGLPMLYVTGVACNALMTHDNFSSGELVPTILGIFIMLSLASVLSGLPLGIAGLVRGEQLRWLSWMGPVSSVTIFSYLMIVQHLAHKWYVAGGPN